MAYAFNLFGAKLYTFVDTAYLNGRDPGELTRQLCAGGSDLIQLRAKGFAEVEVLALANKLVPIADAAGVPLVINDFPKVALQTGAQFCHLGQEDFFDCGYRTARDIWGESKAIVPKLGLSTHTPNQAQRALAAVPAYIAIGPVFATPTKPGAIAVTLDYVRWASANVNIPWFAIGGINLSNIDQVLEAGATRICVVSAILNTVDIALACKRFRAKLGA